MTLDDHIHTAADFFKKDLERIKQQPVFGTNDIHRCCYGDYVNGWKITYILEYAPRGTPTEEVSSEKPWASSEKA